MTTVNNASPESVKMGENFLEHFGVRGMKWGVRGARAANNIRKSRKVKPISEDAQRHAAAKKKHLSELSDKELKDLALRLNMEQQVKRMNPASLTKGHNAAKTVVATVGTITALTAIAQGPLPKKIGRALVSIGTNQGRKALTGFDTSGIGKTKGIAK